MNNGYNNIPNNYGINNNFDNNNNNNINNGNNENGNNVLFIGVIILLIVGVVVIGIALFGNNTAEKNLAEEQKKEPTVSEKPNENEQPTTTNPPENNQQNQNNQQSGQNQQPQNNTNTQTTSKTSLKCTGTAKNEYGTYKYEHSYTFKSNSTMKSAILKTTVTLNKSYVGYRDSILQSLKEENKKFVKLDGISESISKKSNGFTYTIKLDATKLSTEELASMGYRTRNYTGVKMKAKEQGLKCS